MLKNAALAVFGLALALSFSAPKAQAEVHVGVAIGTPAVYGSVAVLPASHDAYYGSYGYYDNGDYDNGYYDNAPYDYYNYNAYPYTSGGTYYDSGRYAPSYGRHWRGDRDYYGRHHHERRDYNWGRKHERWHEKHDRDRW